MNLKKYARKLKTKDFDYFNAANYVKYYENMPIKKNTILLEPQHGNNLNGNIFYLVQELEKNPQFKDFTVYLVYRKGKEDLFKNLLKRYDIKNIHLVRINSNEYYQLCASAEYLINDTSFNPFFIKKNGQKYLNVWHGTPLKTLGKKDNSGYDQLGNIQRNFIMADYLLYPSDYMRKHMIEDYMLENIAPGSSLMGGYPRNSIFFNKERGQQVREELRENGFLTEDVQRVYAYMPTWRGEVGKVLSSDQVLAVTHLLREIDERLRDDEVMFVNLHPFVKAAVDYTEFHHIKPFDESYETYDFLNSADVLVTDYSSVFYDFADSNKKTVLFVYDKEDYFKDRGVYEPLEDLPFAAVENIDALISELRSEETIDLSAFHEKYNKFDRPESSREILERFLLNKENDLQIIPIPDNGKDRVLIYGGSMAKNGITSSLISLVNHLDTEERNYYVSFPMRAIKRNREVLKQLPENVSYIPIPGKMNSSISQKFIPKLYRKDLYPEEASYKEFDKIFPLDIKRIYPGKAFSDVVQFNGYDFKRIHEFARYPANRVIFAHNDMIQELKTKNNSHERTLRFAYNNYDKVAVVSEDIIPSIMQLTDSPEKVKVVNNTIDYKTIRKKGDEPIEFDENTEATCTIDELQEILDSNKKVFINIGRFSPEKGHERLMKAFDKIHKENPETHLIIIGGMGALLNETMEIRDSLDSRDFITIIKSVHNPQPILRQSDYFVLSSFYEGLGLVLLEADIQGVPAVSTNITGPQGFMMANGGTLVDDSQEGIEEGMRLCLEGKVKPMNVDYEEYNRQAVAEFESLL